MGPDTVNIPINKAVIQPFVVAIVEALLLKVPLLIPIGFGNEQEIGIRTSHGWDEHLPEIGSGLRTCTVAPRLTEDFVHYQHGYVATNAIAHTRDPGHSIKDGFPETGIKHIDLQHILPGRVKGILSAGEHPFADIDKRHRVCFQFINRSPDKKIGVNGFKMIFKLLPIVIQLNILINFMC